MFQNFDMYICIYVMYLCIYVFMYLCIYLYMYICIYVYMYTSYMIRGCKTFSLLIFFAV